MAGPIAAVLLVLALVLLYQIVQSSYSNGGANAVTRKPQYRNERYSNLPVRCSRVLPSRLAVNTQARLLSTAIVFLLLSCPLSGFLTVFLPCGWNQMPFAVSNQVRSAQFM